MTAPRLPADPGMLDDAVAEEEEDWFGEGSDFDSGEDLAAALFSMANVAPPAGRPSDPSQRPVPHAAVFEEFPRHVAESGAALAAHPETEWMPIPSQEQAPRALPVTSHPSWTVRQAKEAISQSEGSGRQWSIRNGVSMLKLTEDVIDRLRQDAIEVTWAAAGVAVAQQSQKRRSNQAASAVQGG